MQHDFSLERSDAYALGTLDPEERRLVDEHLALCGSCSRAIGEAEQIVCSLLEMTTPLVDPPSGLQERISRSTQRASTKPRLLSQLRTVPSWIGLAAAAVFGLGLETTHLYRENVALEAIDSRNDAVLAVIATSHFKHVSLTPSHPGFPSTKVLYAPKGGWLYLVVDAATVDCHLVARYSEGTRDLGTPRSNGSTSTLFVRDAGKPLSVTLVSAAGENLAGAELQ